jgi:hypothetical protein
VIALAIMTKKPWIRIVTSSFVFFILLVATTIGIDSAPRHVITDSVNNGTLTEEFAHGVDKLWQTLLPVKIFGVLCGAGLFLISLKTQLGRVEKKKKTTQSSSVVDNNENESSKTKEKGTGANLNIDEKDGG